jgi:ubiquinone/menaquinone biosynthesis C-methylase UbiE
MVRRWSRFRDPWDREYAKRGRIWRGQVKFDDWPARWTPSTRVLELGCGDGKFLEALSRRGLRGVGLDRAPNALKLATRAHPDTLIRGDVLALPFKQASWTAIAARYVLGALTAPQRSQASAEIWRILGPGGLILLEEFGRGDFRETKGELVEPSSRLRNDGLLTHYFETDEVTRLWPDGQCQIQELSWTQRTTQGVKPRRVLRATIMKPAPERTA